MPPNDFVQSASRKRLFFGENLCLPGFRSFFVVSADINVLCSILCRLHSRLQCRISICF